MKVTLNGPRRPRDHNWNPTEALLWDSVCDSPDDVVELPDGLRALLPRFDAALGNLIATGHLATAEGISAPAQRPHEWGADIQRMGAAKAKAEVQHEKLALMGEGTPGPTHEPFGFALPPTRIDA